MRSRGIAIKGNEMSEAAKKVSLMFSNDDETKEWFSIIFNGFVLGGDQPGMEKGMLISHREARILDQFDEFGIDDANVGKMLGTPRAEMVLERADFDLLLKYFRAAKWSTRVAQKIVQVEKWLVACAGVGAG